MTDPVAARESWELIQEAEDNAILAAAHADLCKRARQIMPGLNAEDAAEVRAAIFAGPGGELRDLILKHYRPWEKP